MSYLSLSTPRDAAQAACCRIRHSQTPPAQTHSHHTPTPSIQSHQHHSPTPSNQGLQHPHTSHPRRPQPRRPVTVTLSSPRLATPTSKWRDYSSPVRNSPGRVSSAVGGGVSNGRLGTHGHRGVGPRTSWSPSRQAPVPIRPRVYSDCYTRPSHLSRSFRIKQWIQARQRR